MPYFVVRAAQDRPALTNKQGEKNLQNTEQVLYIDSPSKQKKKPVIHNYAAQAHI